MELTNQDKALVKKWGYLDQDIKQIEQAASICIYIPMKETNEYPEQRL